MATLLDLIESDIEISQTEEFATEAIPCPPCEAPATIHKVTRKSFTSGEDTYFLLNISWLVDSEEAREETHRDKVYVDQTIFLNLELDKCANMEAVEAEQQLWIIDKDSNPEFGKLRKWLISTGYEMPTSWIAFWMQLSDDILGKEAFVKIKQRPRKLKDLDDDGEPIVVIQAYVSSISKI